MKRALIHLICAVCAIALLSCQGRSDGNYVAINKTDSNIGLLINYGKIKAIVEPSSKFEHYEKVNGIHPHVPSFKLSNLDDTISINISAQTILRIWEGTSLITRTDTILYNSYSRYGRYTYQWIITETLLSTMEYDETLLTEFADFYKK